MNFRGVSCKRAGSDGQLSAGMAAIDGLMETLSFMETVSKYFVSE
jgi:hypothetical protein